MLKNQKHLFQLREDVHYLNCAYKAPMLKSVEAAALKDLEKQRNPMDIGPATFFDETEEVRVLFGKLVGCKPSEVAIVPSVSYGLSSVLNNIQGKSGQNAITIESEFPSDYFSLKRWCDENQAEMLVVGPEAGTKLKSENWNKCLLQSINEHTAIVNMSSVHWMNGTKFDLQKIGEKCRAVGAKFIVDGTQSVGALPIDVKKCHIDALVCATYKWMLGPYSCGLAYIGNAFNGGKPLEESWMNRTNAMEFSNLTTYETEYKPDAGRYNVGQMSNFVLMPMLKAALTQIHEWTVPGIQEYARKLGQPIREYLQDLGVVLEPSEYSAYHLFGLNLPEGIDTELLKENLAQNKIYLSVRGSILRVAINVFNTEEDVEKLLGVIEQTRKSSLQESH